MNLLLKIEEAINQLLEKLFEKLKALTPAIFFALLHALKNFPKTFFSKLKKTYKPKIRLIMLKFVGHIEHYITIVRGHITSLAIYLRSDEFKKTDKKQLILKPLQYARFNPLKAFSIVTTAALILLSGSILYSNAAKILSGTKALRNPASFSDAEEDLFIEFKNHKFEVAIGGGGGGHGGGGEAEEVEIHLDLRIEAKNEQGKALMEQMEEMLDDSLEGLHLPIHALPISEENKKEIELLMVKSLNEDFASMGYKNPIKSIEIKQKLAARPVYYRQAEKMFKVEDINLQLFLEDTKHNRQIWLDFSILATNRNAILYLKDHEVELKDHITTNVEPVIPQLPIEEEGRQIIKEKLRSEINEFLKKNQIEGKVIEIYLDYLMVS